MFIIILILELLNYKLLLKSNNIFIIKLYCGLSLLIFVEY